MKGFENTKHPPQWPNSFDSQAQCSAITKIPVGMLKDWKKEGAPGFEFNRVYVHECLPWYFENLSKTNGTLDLHHQRTRREMLEADKLEREKAIDENALHTRAGVEAVLWERGLSPLRSSLLQFEHNTGQKLRTLMQSYNLPEAQIAEIIAVAVAGVNDPLEKLHAVLPKPETNGAIK